MSELRLDITTQQWVIIASARKGRPHDFRQASEAEPPADGCPFCLGNEDATPPEILRRPATAAWRVRVVPNRYPAALPGDPIRITEDATVLPARGAHEVVIESPDHADTLVDLDPDHLALVFDTYQARYRELAARPEIEAISVFKNHGRRAGASLAHPHSQIVAVPFIPPLVERRLQVARTYHEARGRCVYSDVVEAERRAGVRILSDRSGTTILQPSASRFPFETWIVPSERCASFGDASDSGVSAVADAVTRALRALRAVLGDFAFNFMVHSAPPKAAERPDFAWFVQIVPRLGYLAGFELATDTMLNSVRPEDATAKLRAAAPELG